MHSDWSSSTHFSNPNSNWFDLYFWVNSDYLKNFNFRVFIMSYHENVHDAKASNVSHLQNTDIGKIRKIRKIKQYRDLRRSTLKASNSAFIRELIPLLNREDTFLM